MKTKIKRESKRNRKAISLDMKQKILDRLQLGEKLVTISKEFNLNESTVRTIKRNEDRIRSSISNGHSTNLSKSCRVKDRVLLQTEHCLNTWIQDCNQKNIPINSELIKEKALIIHAKLTDDIDNSLNKPSSFVASKGWYERFKQRFNLNSRDKEIREDRSSNAELCGVYLKDEFNSCDESMLPKSNFPLTILNEGLELAKQLEMYFLQNDPLMERSLEFKTKLEDCLAPYYKLQSQNQSSFMSEIAINNIKQEDIDDT